MPLIAPGVGQASVPRARCARSPWPRTSWSSREFERNKPRPWRRPEPLPASHREGRSGRRRGL